jgi:hypothetical protein
VTKEEADTRLRDLATFFHGWPVQDIIALIGFMYGSCLSGLDDTGRERMAGLLDASKQFALASFAQSGQTPAVSKEEFDANERRRASGLKAVH